MKSVLVIFIFLSGFAFISDGYKILGIFPTSSKSHSIVGTALMRGLAERGHDVTVMIPHGLNEPLKNYRQIPLHGIMRTMKQLIGTFSDFINFNIFQALKFNYFFGLLTTNSTFHEKVVHDLVNSNETFDLIVLEMFVNEAMLGFAHRFNAPVVGVSTFGASIWTCDAVGSPSPPSYVPNSFIGYSNTMTFSQRALNFVVSIFERLYNDFIYLPMQEELYNNFFPDPKPPLRQLQNNVSLILLNTHFTLGEPRPYVPNMIEIGGVHVNRKPHPLPNRIQKFLDSSPEGVVYFAMGSNMRSELMPNSTRIAIENALSSLKHKVLWKWEETHLKVDSKRILMSDWFPQGDVLNHPNVKLFITHGGLLSTTEAIYHGVPVIGIPVFADQFLNMARAVEAEIGLSINFNDLTEDKLTNAIDEVLSNKKYAENMKLRSKRYRDQPMEPLDTAAYWVEYVIRHKGAPHLHSAGQELNFLQYHSLDIVAVLCLILLIVFYILFTVVRKLASSLHYDKGKSLYKSKNIKKVQ